MKATEVILFQGKRADTGEWVEGCSILTLKRGDEFLFYMPKSGENVRGQKSIGQNLYAIAGNFYRIIESSIGQFTGAVDKNETKVFGGHIVRITADPPIVPEHNGNIADVALDGIEGWILRFCDGYERLSDYSPDDIEVIGNTYDNEELLEV